MFLMRLCGFYSEILIPLPLSTTWAWILATPSNFDLRRQNFSKLDEYYLITSSWITLKDSSYLFMFKGLI